MDKEWMDDEYLYSQRLSQGFTVHPGKSFVLLKSFDAKLIKTFSRHQSFTLLFALATTIHLTILNIYKINTFYFK